MGLENHYKVLRGHGGKREEITGGREILCN